MNPVVVLLGVLLVVIIVYMIYTTYYSTTVKLSGEVHLITPPANIPIDKITKPDATRYAYGIWFYVNNFPTSFGTGNIRTIFYREKDMHLYLTNDGSLSLAVGKGVDQTTTKASTTSEPIRRSLITNNFPIQRWVYIVVSIDNTVIDVYLDGKLVKSIATPQVGPQEKEIIFKSAGVASGMDAYLSNFERVTTPLDPQSVWNKYIGGSGSNLAVSNMVGKYNLNLTLLKDGQISQKYKLF